MKKIKCKYINKNNNYNHFNFSILFVNYKTEEVEKCMSRTGTTKNNFHLWHIPNLFFWWGPHPTSQWTTYKVNETDITYGFQEMKTVPSMLKRVNMIQIINQRGHLKVHFCIHITEDLLTTQFFPYDQSLFFLKVNLHLFELFMHNYIL